MTEQQYRARVRYVIGPDGSPLTIADLPPKDTKRWVIRRKAEVVAAVRGGLLSLEEACEPVPRGQRGRQVDRDREQGVGAVHVIHIITGVIA